MAAPKQLPLDLGHPPAARFSHFVNGDNAEIVARLQALPIQLQQSDLPASDRLLYLWGPPGCGRSHLLQASCHALVAAGREARYLNAHSPLFNFSFHADIGLYAVDDIDRFAAHQQIALFNLINEVRAHGRCALLGAGAHAPLGLDVREDLRTRLGWGLVYQIHPLSDVEKADAITQAARVRGLHLSPDVPGWLLSHFQRDMPSLMSLLDALDHYSLEHKRAITLPLVRQMLAEIRPIP